MIDTGIIKKLAGVTGLCACVISSNSLAEPLTYSADRWPARWSSIVQQVPVYQASSAYAYGRESVQVHSQQAHSRQDNPWVHTGSGLFEVPVAHRPWGEPPRQQQRRRERTLSYRDRSMPMSAQNYDYPASGFGYGAPTFPTAYSAPMSGYSYPYTGFAPAFPYGASPLLGSPLLTYPYGVHPLGMGGMNWPFGAW